MSDLGIVACYSIVMIMHYVTWIESIALNVMLQKVLPSCRGLIDDGTLLCWLTMDDKQRTLMPPMGIIYYTIDFSGALNPKLTVYRHALICLLLSQLVYLSVFSFS